MNYIELINFFKKTDISKIEIIQLLNLYFENINFDNNIKELLKEQYHQKQPVIILQLIRNYKEMIKENDNKFKKIVNEIKIRQKK